MKSKEKLVPLTREQFISRTIEKAEAKKLVEAKKNAVRLISIN